MPRSQCLPARLPVEDMEPRLALKGSDCEILAVTLAGRQSLFPLFRSR